MKVGLSTACYYSKKHTEAALEDIGRQGVDLCEVFLCSASEYEPSFVEDLHDISLRYGVRVQSIHPVSTQFEPQLFSRNERQRSDAFDVFRTLMDRANMLEASMYVLHGPMLLKRTNDYSTKFENIAPHIDRLAETAKQHGLRFTLENVHWCIYHYPGFEQGLLKHCESDNVYFTLDVKQAVMSGHSPFDYLSKMGRRLANIHICDYIEERDRTRLCLPGDGHFDFYRLKNELDAIGYDGNLIVEVYADNFDTDESLFESLSLMKRIFE